MHELSFDRSSMTRWRQRMGEEKLAALLQESLGGSCKGWCWPKPSDFTKVIVDTTVARKERCLSPQDAKLINRARVRLVKMARVHNIKLRQSYKYVGKDRSDHASALMPMPNSLSGQKGSSGHSKPTLAAPSVISNARL